MQVKPSPFSSTQTIQSPSTPLQSTSNHTTVSAASLPVQPPHSSSQDQTQVNAAAGRSTSSVSLVEERAETLDLAAVRAGKGILEAGSKGPGVAELQTLLNKLGYTVPSSGEMGPETVAMLEKFQRDYGVEPTKKLGPTTLKVLDWAIQQTNAIAALRKVTPAQLKKMNPTQFFKTLMPAALESERKYKVPAAVTLAQAALESGWGRAPIGGYNIFGIKGQGPAGSVRVSTQEFLGGRYVTIQAKFAKYHDFYEAVSEHGKNYHNGYYQKALQQFAKDRNVNRFIDNIASIYATDPNYASKLKGMIRDYGIDKLVAQARSPR